MAKYTVELNDIVNSGVKIFNFDYEYYNNSKKPDFEQKFINHFRFREIGFETVGRFQHYLKVKLDERLPYYNEILKLSQLEYDILNPYSITETFEKTDSKNTSTNGTQTGSVNRTANATTTGNKTNTLDSDTNHTETIAFSKNETISETSGVDNTNTVEVDGKKVGSDTPNGLLSMTDIKNNVYASKADVEDSTTKTTDKQTTNAEKDGNTSEKTSHTSTDAVNVTSKDISTDVSNETATEGSTNTANATGTESGTEEYTLHRTGHIGVQTKSELLEKQIEVLKKMQTVFTQFFDECEDLFMQIY